MAEKEAPKQTTSMVKFVVEVDSPRNAKLQWTPDGRTLRGRWDPKRVNGSASESSFQRMPILPGLYIVMDGPRRVLRFADPLNDPKNADRLKLAQETVQNTFGERHGPEVDVEVKNLTDDEIKTACYWVRRYLDDQKVTVREGAVPTIAEVDAMPGDITIQDFNAPGMAKKVDISKNYRAPLPVQTASVESQLQPV